VDYGTFTLKTLEIQQAAVDEADENGITISTGDVTVRCDPATGCGRGFNVQVIVRYDFGLIMGIFLDSPIRISKMAEMMIP
jgi:hypothetical protein